MLKINENSNSGQPSSGQQQLVDMIAQLTEGGKRTAEIIRAIGLCFFALIWGYAGLAQIVFGSFGSGILTLLLAAIPAFFAKKLLWPAKPSNQKPVEGSRASSSMENFAALSGGRQNVKSKLYRLVLTFFVSLPLLFVGLTLLAVAPDKIIWTAGLGLTVWTGFIGLTALRSLLSGGVVFYFDETGITIPRLLGQVFIPWSEVKGFTTETINTYVYVVFKVASDHIIYVEKHMGNRVKLPTRYTGMDSAAIRDVIARMEMQRFSPQRKPSPVFNAPQPVQPQVAKPSVEMPVQPVVHAPDFNHRSSLRETAKFARRPSGFVSRP